MLLLKNARLYGFDAKPKDVLICEKKIIWIAESVAFPLREGDTVIDCAGKVAIPGYVDQHVHITGGGGEGGFSYQVPPIRLSELIRAGVTTVVGLLGTDGTGRSVEGLVSKTKALIEEGWTAYCLTGSYELPSKTITGSVTRDITFISEIIGVKVAISDHRSAGPSRQELIRLAAEARMGGLLSAKAGVVHMHLGAGRDELRTIIDIVKTTDVPVRVFKPTHMGSHIDQGAEFAKLGGYVDFTAGEDASHTADIIMRAREKIPHELITMSSDGNGSLPIWNDKKEIVGIGTGDVGTDHAAVRELVRNRGLALADAITMLTENPARSLGLYPNKGLIAEGSDADVLLLDDELNIDTVIANGRLYMQGKKLMYKPKFES